jgi:hypothetical protein
VSLWPPLIGARVRCAAGSEWLVIEKYELADLGGVFVVIKQSTATSWMTRPLTRAEWFRDGYSIVSLTERIS